MNKQVLVSLVIIGVVGAFATGSTFALFNDSEVSEDNTFTAGEFDLMVDYVATYNGNNESSAKFNESVETIYELDDIKPGDYGENVVSLHLFDNPGYVWANFEQTEDADNTCTDPEGETEEASETDCNPEGELNENVEAVLFYDENGDGVMDEEDEELFNGTMAELFEEEHLIDANPETNETEPIQPEQASFVTLQWNVPTEVGNEIQTDSFMYDLELYAEQSRHNDDPASPWE